MGQLPFSHLVELLRLATTSEDSGLIEVAAELDARSGGIIHDYNIEILIFELALGALAVPADFKCKADDKSRARLRLADFREKVRI